MQLFNQMTLLAQEGGGIAGLLIPLVALALTIVVVAGIWKVFVKAGQPGWGCLVPFYNLYLMIKIAGRPGIWFILFFIPLVNFIVLIIIPIDIARKFGKGAAFGLGLVFLGFIFYPILGFGDAEYNPNLNPTHFADA